MRGSSLFHLPLLKRWHTLRALIRGVHNGTAMPHLLGPPHFIHLADLLRTVALRSCLFGNHLPVRPGDTVGMAYSYVMLRLCGTVPQNGFLVDAEGPVTPQGPWHHLQTTDG